MPETNPEFIKVEFLESFKHAGEEYEEGDRMTYRDPHRVKLAQDWIACGLCKDLSGEIPTGERGMTRKNIVLEEG